MLPLHKCEADALVQRDAVVAGSHRSDLGAVLEFDRIPGPGDCVVLEFDTDDLHGRAVGLLGSYRLLADELFLVQLAEHAESGRNG